MGDENEDLMALKEVFILKSLSQISGFPKLLKAYSTPDDGKNIGMPKFNLVMNNVGKPIEYSGNIIEARRILVETVKLLCILHDNGIVHCDIKPNNILIDDSGRISIIDFSHSYMLSGPNFKTTEWILQTQLYSAPESESYDPNKNTKIDIWSLGCVYYELLTNQQLTRLSDILKCDKSDQYLLSRMLDVNPLTRADGHKILGILNVCYTPVKLWRNYDKDPDMHTGDIPQWYKLNGALNNLGYHIIYCIEKKQKDRGFCRYSLHQVIYMFIYALFRPPLLGNIDFDFFFPSANFDEQCSVLFDRFITILDDVVGFFPNDYFSIKK